MNTRSLLRLAVAFNLIAAFCVLALVGLDAQAGRGVNGYGVGIAALLLAFAALIARSAGRA